MQFSFSFFDFFFGVFGHIWGTFGALGGWGGADEFFCVLGLFFTFCFRVD
jgi:hypothetical protein